MIHITKKTILKGFFNKLMTMLIMLNPKLSTPVLARDLSKCVWWNRNPSSSNRKMCLEGEGGPQWKEKITHSGFGRSADRLGFVFLGGFPGSASWLSLGVEQHGALTFLLDLDTDRTYSPLYITAQITTFTAVHVTMLKTRTIIRFYTTADFICITCQFHHSPTHRQWKLCFWPSPSCQR